jgi:hypothetical protein
MSSLPGREPDVWVSTLPAEPPPVPGWWTAIETREQYETRRWAEGLVDARRAERAAVAEARASERSERLRRRVREVDVRLDGVGYKWWRRPRSGPSDAWGDDDPRAWRGLPIEHSKPAPVR